MKDILSLNISKETRLGEDGVNDDKTDHTVARNCSAR